MQSLGPKTILMPAPVLCVGTYGADGKPNVMTAAWGGICCSRPPCVTVSLRQATHTHGNIVARKAFTISIPSREQAVLADRFGLSSGRDGDKFAASGLAPVRAEHVDAPYVDGFPLVVECALLETVEIGLHTMFVGEVKDVKAREDCLDAEGRIDPAKVDPIAYMPEAGSYYGLGQLIGKAFSIGRTPK
jgi:flavin reductase (DIM6/NTAB) family NADH-FMN oxidoreductase RutF